MRQFNEDTLTAEVVARLKETKDKRFREIMTSAVKHLHAFAREVHLTEEEWFEGIKFLTAVGQKCDGKRQEFILLSDVLGLVDDGGGAQPQDRARRDRGHRARAVLRARREGVRLRRRPARGRDDERRGRVGQRASADGGRKAGCQRHARHLAGQGRRHLRPADRGRIRAARPGQGQRQRRIRVRELQAEVLQHPDGRAGRRPGARHQQQPHAAGAHARHRRRAGVPAGHHARVRRRRSRISTATRCSR